MWRSCCQRGNRRLSSAAAGGGRRWPPKDEGDWSYASEWWGSASDGHSVFRSISDHGNGIVSVVARPSSRPAPEHWQAREAWLEERYAKIHPNSEHHVQFMILGYQWRTLRFNDNTRQSTVKVMATCKRSDPASLYLMQQPHCLAVPYLKSMVSAGLVALASSGYNLRGSVTGKTKMRVLCIGHGGGSLPLFLASKIKGAIVDIVEIDPVVISASVEAMGFPASSLMEAPDQFSFKQPTDADQLLYGSLSRRLSLFGSDAENFVAGNNTIYDLVFIDAYDGDDIFPRKLWDPEGPFLKSLESMLHRVHGTVVVNLHSDSDVSDSDHSDHQFILPMGKYISQVCTAYKERFGRAVTVSVPWLCNMTLVASRGLGVDVDRNKVYFNRRPPNPFFFSVPCVSYKSSYLAPSEAPSMDSISHRSVAVNGINMHIAEKGDGPVILFLHGFPELWYSWRHQILSLAARGYRAVAPDLRGYGDTDAPPAAASYSILHIVGDLVALIDALGQEQVFVVGHDWGAVVAWSLCMLRPDRVKALVNMSVVYTPRNPARKPLDSLRAVFSEDYYMCRFQEPGKAESEFSSIDTALLLKKFLTYREPRALVMPKGKAFGGSPNKNITLPSWLTEEDINYFANKFEKSGFTGGLNYYRCLDLNWELTAPWTKVQIKVPVKFIVGDLDLTYHTPGVQDYIHKGGFKRAVPFLHDVIVMEQVGHFINQEKPHEISEHIYDFIQKF